MPTLLSVVAAGLAVTMGSACASLPADPAGSPTSLTAASTVLTQSPERSTLTAAPASPSVAPSPSPAVSGTSIVPAAYTSPVPRRISPATFGMHPAGGQVASGMVGSVRLWDSGTSWGSLQPSGSRPPSFTALDRAVEQARAAGATDFLIVIGLPAKWAAASPKTTYTYFPGLSTSPPASLSQYRQYVTRLATHVNGITGTTWSFEVWNEFDLPDFYSGSASTLAAMTGVVDQAVKGVNPAFKTVAPSVTVRRGVQPAFGAYLSALSTVKGYKNRSWPVDAWSVHPYPRSIGTPSDTVRHVATFRQYLAGKRAPSKPVWNTEVNYGLPGPSGAKRVDITGVKEPAWLARTYLDAIRTGVDRVYWYAWLPRNSYLGIVTYTGTPATGALRTLHGWLAGATFSGCTGGTLHVCRFTKDGTAFRMAWTEGGASSLTLTSPTRTCLVQGRVGGLCTTSPAGKFAVGGTPVRIG